VIGLGEVYLDYRDKIVSYYNALNDADWSDDDIVMLLDAYDVIMLPESLEFPWRLSHSSHPIMFCGERGIYPDIQSE